MARPPEHDSGRRLTHPTPATTPTATTTPKVTATLADSGDAVAAEAAEAAEQLAWDWHLAELCSDGCPWCTGGWAS